MQTKLLKTIVVDDEKPSREALATYIRDFCPGVEIVAECDSVKSAYQAIMVHHPHLVFLDIEMPNGNGFDLLQLFKSPDFKVIFITAFSDYAIRAFRYSASDYLLKPVKVDELIEAIDKVKQELLIGQDNLNLLTLMENLNPGGNPPIKLVVPNNRGFAVINTAELIMCQADGYVTHFYMLGKIKISSSKILKHYVEVFDHQLFRVHRSYLINLAHVKGYTLLGDVLLADNLSCPLGITYKQHFIEALGKKV
jgi:two-component system LytT family response regulator